QERLPGAASLLDMLRMAIYQGELTPGQRLVEAEIAVRYDASRGAVREALALLSNEGLVVHERNRGARVRPVTLDEAVEITEARAALEGLCAARAAAVISASQRRELRTSQQLHGKVREIAEQATMSTLLDRLRHQGVRYQFQVSLLPGRPAQSLQE